MALEEPAYIASDENDGEGMWIYQGENGDWYVTTGYASRVDPKNSVPVAPTLRVCTSGTRQPEGFTLGVALLYHLVAGNKENVQAIAATLGRLK